MEPEIKTYVDNKIAEAVKFNTPKYGDTPTDALQLTPKKYVSSVAASLVSAINAVASFSGVTSPGGANKQIQYNNGGGFGGDPALTWSGSVLTVGQQGSVTGQIKLAGATTGTVQVQTASSAGNWVMTLPANDGDSNQVLVTDGNGVTSWVSAILPAVGAAKGDLIGFSGANAPARLAVGTNGQYLIADSAETLGVKWDSVVSGGSGSPGGSNGQIQYNGGSSFAGARVTYVDETADGHTPTVTFNASVVSLILQAKDATAAAVTSKNTDLLLSASVFTMGSINFKGPSIRLNKGGSVTGAGDINIQAGQASITGGGAINIFSGSPPASVPFGAGGDIFISTGSSIGGNAGAKITFRAGAGTSIVAGQGHVSAGGDIVLAPGDAEADDSFNYGVVKIARPSSNNSIAGGFFKFPIVTGPPLTGANPGESVWDFNSNKLWIYTTGGWKSLTPT